MIRKLVLSCVLIWIQSCGGEVSSAALIEPCRSTDENVRPITRECVAAGIAESAFLKKASNGEAKYVISPLEHTATEWHFLILLGDEKSPPPPGGHFSVAVDRATGETVITPGA
jgi:hypothetical protein